MRFECEFSYHHELMIEHHLCSMRMRQSMRKCARTKINMHTNWINCGMPIGLSALKCMSLLPVPQGGCELMVRYQLEASLAAM
jgi:hypothetical protein